MELAILGTLRLEHLVLDYNGQAVAAARLAGPVGDGRTGRFPAAAAASGFATVLNRCFRPKIGGI
jgi:hypothetical protein